MNVNTHDIRRFSLASLAAGFTLVELLITIGVVVSLLLITVGASLKVLDHQKRTRDISNLRALGQGLHLYIAENSQKLPEISTPLPVKTIAVQLGIMSSVDQYNGADFSKMDLSIFGPLISPTDPRKHRCPWNSYGSNYYMGNNPAQPRTGQSIHAAFRYTDIVNPSAKLYLLPTEAAEGYTGHGRFTEGSAPWSARAGSVTIRFDSNGYTPALFMDGHVAPISQAETSDPNTNSPRSWIFPLR